MTWVTTENPVTGFRDLDGTTGGTPGSPSSDTSHRSQSSSDKSYYQTQPQTHPRARHPQGLKEGSPDTSATYTLNSTGNANFDSPYFPPSPIEVVCTGRQGWVVIDRSGDGRLHRTFSEEETHSVVHGCVQEEQEPPFRRDRCDHPGIRTHDTVHADVSPVSTPVTDPVLSTVV